MLADRWLVGGVVKYRRRRGKDEYLVSWIGWDSTHNTWEPVRNINNDDLIDKFWEDQEKNFGKKRPNRNKRRKGKKTKRIKKKDDEGIDKEDSIIEDNPFERRQFVIKECLLPDNVVLYQHSVDVLYKMLKRTNTTLTEISLLEEASIYNDEYTKWQNLLSNPDLSLETRGEYNEQKLKCQLQLEYIRKLLNPYLTQDQKDININHLYIRKERPRKEGDPEDAEIEYYDELIGNGIKEELESDEEEYYGGEMEIKQEVDDYDENRYEENEEDRLFREHAFHEEEIGGRERMDINMEIYMNEENGFDNEQGYQEDGNYFFEGEEDEEDAFSEGEQMEDDGDFILSEDEEIRDYLMEQAEQAAREDRENGYGHGYQEPEEQEEEERYNGAVFEEDQEQEQEIVGYYDEQGEIPQDHQQNIENYIPQEEEEEEVAEDVPLYEAIVPDEEEIAEDHVPAEPNAVFQRENEIIVNQARIIQERGIDVAVNFPEERDNRVLNADDDDFLPQDPYNARSPSSSSDSNISSKST